MCVRVFFDTYFSAYVIGLCPYTDKFGSDKIFILACLIQCPTDSIGKLRYNIFLGYTCKMLCMKRQTWCNSRQTCWNSVDSELMPNKYWASILNLLNSNQIPQDSHWRLLPISDLKKLKRHIVVLKYVHMTY